jgi:hypothetical protein
MQDFISRQNNWPLSSNMNPNIHVIYFVAQSNLWRADQHWISHNSYPKAFFQHLSLHSQTTCSRQREARLSACVESVAPEQRAAHSSSIQFSRPISLSHRRFIAMNSSRAYKNPANMTL